MAAACRVNTVKAEICWGIVHIRLYNAGAAVGVEGAKVVEIESELAIESKKENEVKMKVRRESKIENEIESEIENQVENQVKEKVI